MKVKAVRLHKVPVADRTAPLPDSTRRGRGRLAPHTALGPAGLESRSGPCVHRAQSPQSKLIRDWLERHSLETPGPWSGRQNNVPQTEGHLS